MSVFSDTELAYLTGEAHLGRLATVDEQGQPHVVPVGWSYNPDLDTIDISGRDFAATRKFRNVRATGKAAIVIDDVLPPWRPRCVQVRGTAQALDDAAPAGEGPPTPMIRIHPTKVVSWGLPTG
ncbi:MAG: PPOX class F420-dependent oxidoreductase [Actinomycetota bacterium]